MKTIPNIAPDINAELLTLDELKDLIKDDTFVDDDWAWIEIRGGYYGVDEDETFYLRAHLVTNTFIDFSAPNSYIHCEMDDYNKTWRIWNLLPDWDNNEIWEDGE